MHVYANSGKSAQILRENLTESIVQMVFIHRKLPWVIIKPVTYKGTAEEVQRGSNAL